MSSTLETDVSFSEYKKYLESQSNEDLIEICMEMGRHEYPERYKLIMDELAGRNIEVNKIKLHHQKEDGLPDHLGINGNAPGDDSLVEKWLTSNEKYKTFWRRFWASFIDGFVHVFLGMLVAGMLASVGKMTLEFILSGLFFVYSIGMHALFGQTVGKFFCKVKVVTVDQQNIKFKHALMRDMVPLILLLLMIVYFLLFLGPSLLGVITPDMSEEEAVQAIYQKAKRIHFVYIILLVLQILWVLVEIMTMLTNDKRRAVHDFIAGTVVVRKELL